MYSFKSLIYTEGTNQTNKELSEKFKKVIERNKIA